MTTGGGAVGGEIFVNIRTDGSAGGGGVPGAGGAPRPAGGGTPPKDPGMSLLNDKQKEQLEKMREEKKALKEYQDFQKLKNKENQNELLNELQRGRRQVTMVAGAVTTGMLARNSKIMSTSMGALQQIFGAFVDVFLMPFIPLIIPVLTTLAKLLPRFKEWWEKLVDEKGWAGALAHAAALLKEMILEWGVKIGEMLGFSREEVEGFYEDVGKWAKAVWDGFMAAVDYIRVAWCRGGGTVWGLIQTMAGDAWSAITDYAKGLWDDWAEEHPVMAAKITSAWCTASNLVSGAWSGAVGYIQETWEASGCNFGTFMLQVASDAGQKIVEGMRWLWGDEGGGLKDKMTSMFGAIGTWMSNKGLPNPFPGSSGHASRVYDDAGNYAGDMLNLEDTNRGAGWKMTLAGDMAQMFGNPMNVLKLMTGNPIGAMGGQDWAKNASAGVGSFIGGLFQGDIDTSGYSRNRYDKNVEQSLTAALRESHIESGADLGLTAKDYQQQMRVFFSNSTEFGIKAESVEVTKKNGQLEVEVEISKNWNTKTFLDGVPIFHGG